MTAVQYIHDSHIVHRNLIPENLLFRTPAEDADIMIAGFGSSRVMEDERFHQLTEICGTPGYMAPEIFKMCTWSRRPMKTCRLTSNCFAQSAMVNQWTYGP
jgi:serine/threonine protein kinase